MRAVRPAHHRTCLAALLALATALPASAQDRGSTPAGEMEMVNQRTRDAIKAGLAFLAQAQNDDGSFGDKSKFKVAVTSFACMAFLAGGNVPGRGKYGQAIERGLRYILDSVQESGYIERAGGESRMHGQGLATLFLAEVYGMSRGPEREEIRQAITKAIKCIQASQTLDGGWGYTPQDRNHEGSITVCSLQALRAARDVGFKVDQRTLIKAMEYLMKSANTDGSFKYRLGGGSNHHTYPLTAAALSTMNAFGVYDSETRLLGKEYPELPGMMRRGMEFMNRYIGNEGMVEQDRYFTSFYYYAQYYAAQAYYKSKYDGRRKWDEWFPWARDQLLQRFQGQGGGRRWVHHRYGDAYATAIAVLILQIPYRYLPSFQR